MGIKLELKVLVDAAVERAFTELPKRLKQIEAMQAAPVWLGEVARFEADQQKVTWSSEGAKSGEKWPDLMQGEGNFGPYIKWKNRNWPKRTINVWRGDTRDSFTKLGNGDHIARVRDGAMEFGSRAKLAAQMDKGQRYGSHRRIFLREKKPVIRRNRRTGKPTPGANWFVLWLKTVPPRPLARKSDVQKKHLSMAFARALLKDAGRFTGGPVGAGLGRTADTLKPDPRA